MPGNPIDVVTGQKIVSPWGNQIRDQTVQPFASVAARNAAIPAPKDGTFAVINGVLMQYSSARGWIYTGLFGQQFAGSVAAGSVPQTTALTIATFDCPSYERDYTVWFRWRALFSSGEITPVAEYKLFNPGGGVMAYAKEGKPTGGNNFAAVFDWVGVVSAAGGRFALSIANLGAQAFSNYLDPTNNQASFMIVGM